MGTYDSSEFGFQYRLYTDLPHNILDSPSDFEHPVLVINQWAPDIIL